MRGREFNVSRSAELRNAVRGALVVVARAVIRSLSKSASRFNSLRLSYPKTVQCNLCSWRGRRFLSDAWHKYIKCPKCSLGVRHRLFQAALQRIDLLSYERIVCGKRVLHFAPEDTIGSAIQQRATSYTTADFLHTGCDLKLDMSNMPLVDDESFDTVIAFDVLEHVPDWQKAVKEVHRILSHKGWAILAVPQKDGLSTTYEDPSITSREGRAEHYGQWDHLRIFGDDFPSIVQDQG